MTHDWVLSAMNRHHSNSTITTVHQPVGPGCSDSCWLPSPLLVPASLLLTFPFADRWSFIYNSSMLRVPHPPTMNLDLISFPGTTILPLDLRQTLLCFQYYVYFTDTILQKQLSFVPRPCFNMCFQLLKIKWWKLNSRFALPTDQWEDAQRKNISIFLGIA